MKKKQHKNGCLCNKCIKRKLRKQRRSNKSYNPWAAEIAKAKRAMNIAKFERDEKTTLPSTIKFNTIQSGGSYTK